MTSQLEKASGCSSSLYLHNIHYCIIVYYYVGVHRLFALLTATGKLEDFHRWLIGYLWSGLDNGSLSYCGTLGEAPKGGTITPPITATGPTRLWDEARKRAAVCTCGLLSNISERKCRPCGSISLSRRKVCDM